MFGLKPEEELVSIDLLKYDTYPSLKELHESYTEDINKQIDFIDGFFEKCEQKVKQDCASNPAKEAVYWKSFVNVTLKNFRKELLTRYTVEQLRHKDAVEAERKYHQPFN